MSQADILPGMPDALAKIPPKAQEYMGLTLDEAIAKAHAIADEAMERYSPQHTLLLYSGGEDSVILAHLMRERCDAVVHIATTISVPQTAAHVRAVTQAWNRPLLESAPPHAYEDLVLGNVLTGSGPNAGQPAWLGFPGPAAHALMYQRLKERALNSVRRMLVGPRGRRGQILQMAGMRWGESQRRFRNASESDADGARVWCSPLVWWTEGHMREYRARYRCRADHQHAPERLCHPGALPRNEVTEHLHMSGDCLCGAYAEEGEIYGLELFYPEVAARIHELEDRARGGGNIPPERCVWGWGAGRERPSGAGRLCSHCKPPAPEDPRQIAMDWPGAPMAEAAS